MFNSHNLVVYKLQPWVCRFHYDKARHIEKTRCNESFPVYSIGKKTLHAKAQCDWFYIKTTNEVSFLAMTLHPKAKYGSIAFIPCLP